MVLNEKTKKTTYHPQNIEKHFSETHPLGFSVVDLTYEQVSKR
jgi:hypothetical protein